MNEFEISQSTEQKDKKYLMNFQVHKSAEGELWTLAAAAAPCPAVWPGVSGADPVGTRSAAERGSVKVWGSRDGRDRMRRSSVTLGADSCLACLRPPASSTELPHVTCCALF